jgi:monolysocardiolipin acyltransferase
MPADDIAVPPSLQWHAASTATIALCAVACKAFLALACTKEVYGLDGFVKVLDERRDIEGRERGLLTGISPSFMLCVDELY